MTRSILVKHLHDLCSQLTGRRCFDKENQTIAHCGEKRRSLFQDSLPWYL